MRLTVLKTVTLVIVALSLAPSYAHVLEAYPRMAVWSPELWREATVFNAQFWLFAVVGAPIDILAVLVPAGLTWALRRAGDRRTAAFTFAGTLCFAAALAAWFLLVAPANSILATWTPGPVPADFDAVRLRWESGHMVVAAFKLVGFVLLALACVLPRPRGVNASR
ncbi:MAG: DUF1772 domain-containing protein [Rhizobiales bacterium]|nr:DUF1772 domain-containing protein [Hyphomicrobiales bacterium]